MRPYPRHTRAARIVPAPRVIPATRAGPDRRPDRTHKHEGARISGVMTLRRCSRCSGMRRSIRLSGFDYAGTATYMITLVTARRQPHFGHIRNRSVHLNAWGLIVDEEWRRSAELRDYIRLDNYVVMPDHFHGIVHFDRPHGNTRGPEARPLYRPPRSLGSLIARFKASCTRRINMLRQRDKPEIWQRNYYETILRGKTHLRRAKRYIEMNPVVVAGRNAGSVTPIPSAPSARPDRSPRCARSGPPACRPR